MFINCFSIIINQIIQTMCIYCRNRKERQTLTPQNHIKHSRLTESDTESQSSFSSASLSDSSSLCQKHKHVITHKIHFPTQHLFMKSPLSNSHSIKKTTGFISPGRYHKVSQMRNQNHLNNHMNLAETEYLQYRKINDNQVLQLKRQINQKDRIIDDLTTENQRLVIELKNQKEYSGNQIEQFIYQLKNSKDEANPSLLRQNKKIQLLINEFERLKNENGEKFRQVKKQIHRMKSPQNNNQKMMRDYQEKANRSKLRVKEVIIEEERCLRWKNNFIYSFLDMMEKVAAKEGLQINKKEQLKHRVKTAWRYLKTLFRQEQND